MGRYLTNRGLPPLVLSTGQLIAASGLLLLPAPFGGFTAPTWQADAILALVALGSLAPESPT